MLQEYFNLHSHQAGLRTTRSSMGCWLEGTAAQFAGLTIGKDKFG
jgi:hypothetical protein